MNRLTRDDLFGLEQYAEVRNGFRAKVLAHKRYRKVAVGPNATLYFEDRLTVQYQVQEMLRVERIFEAAEIQSELDAYNPLIPDGNNWKATFMLEFPDVEERRRALAELIAIEDEVWVEVPGQDKVFAVADEDLERETDEKTSAVHFLRFQLPGEFIAAVQAGAPVRIGIDHPAYQRALELPREVRDALAEDLRAH